MAKKAMNGWRPKKNGCEPTVVPDEICLSPQLSGLHQVWTGRARFRKSVEVLSEQTKPSAESDFSPEVKGDILDLRPTQQQGRRWNLPDPKDQREILWLIRRKRPKLVIGYGRCIQFCTGSGAISVATHRSFLSRA